MAEPVPFLEPGAEPPVRLEGVDVDGDRVSLDDLLERHGRVLVYFYPFEDRAEPPDAWRLLADEKDRLREKGVGVVGVRGPGIATRDAIADLDRLPFPLIEDPNYRIGQAWGVLGGGVGDDIDTKDEPRALVMVGQGGRVLRSARGDDGSALRRVLAEDAGGADA